MIRLNIQEERDRLIEQGFHLISELEGRFALLARKTTVNGVVLLMIVQIPKYGKVRSSVLTMKEFETLQKIILSDT